MLQVNRGMHRPGWGDVMPRGWEKTDQYSSGKSSVVTLRSLSVMIQSLIVAVT